MINRLLGLVAKFAVGKQLVGAVNAANKRLSGARSEILIGLSALLWVLEHFGILRGPEVDALQAALLGALPITIAEKIKKGQEMADRVIPKPENPA